MKDDENATALDVTVCAYVTEVISRKGRTISRTLLAILEIAVPFLPDCAEEIIKCSIFSPLLKVGGVTELTHPACGVRGISLRSRFSRNYSRHLSLR